MTPGPFGPRFELRLISVLRFSDFRGFGLNRGSGHDLPARVGPGLPVCRPIGSIALNLPRQAEMEGGLPARNRSQGDAARRLKRAPPVSAGTVSSPVTASWARQGDKPLRGLPIELWAGTQGKDSPPPTKRKRAVPARGAAVQRSCECAAWAAWQSFVSMKLVV